MTGRIARQDGGEIEPETIHVHFLHPVAKAVHDHAADNGMIGVEGIPGTAEIGVPGAIVVEDVVGAVVDPAKAQRRAVMVAFGGVIEHHVENDLDSRPVQRLDHVAKFVHRTQGILTRAVRLVRRKERNRCIAPVIDRPCGAILSVELEDRQQFDGGDAELLKIRNLLDQTGVRAAVLSGTPELGCGREPAHVHLVNDGARGWPV